MSEASFQLFPVLDAATEAALRASIERFGVLVPVAKDQHGRILDGFHRSRLADELGVAYRVDVHVVADDGEAREIARTLNADRRQLTVEQRREVVSVLREQGHSLRAIGGAVGVTKSQVERDLAGVPDGTPAAETIGRDGKRYPARRTVVTARNQREEQRAFDALSTVEQPPASVMDVKRAERVARERLAEQRRAEPVAPTTEVDDVTIVYGDFRDSLDTYDLIGGVVVTDPPYPREFLNEWQDMAQAALEWGCDSLVAMCGQAILPDALNLIGRAWEPARDEYIDEAQWVYRWCGAYMTSGPATRIWNANVGSSWKPILVFDRGEARDFLITDVFRSTGDDKRHHRWGQNEAGIAAVVEAFTKPGDLVVDPFLGGGTTAVVCRDLGRRFVGCDIDAAAVAATRERLAA